jgi:hypothetical protein
MRRAVGFVLFFLASLPAAQAAEIPVQGFDAPPATLNLTQPDRVFVAGLKPDESLSGPARSAATPESACSRDDVRFGGCTQAEGATSGLLSGHAHAASAAVAGGAAGGLLAVGGLVSLLKDD